jgi:hypothetical protein
MPKILPVLATPSPSAPSCAAQALTRSRLTTIDQRGLRSLGQSMDTVRRVFKAVFTACQLSLTRTRPLNYALSGTGVRRATSASSAAPTRVALRTWSPARPRPPSGARPKRCQRANRRSRRLQSPELAAAAPTTTTTTMHEHIVIGDATTRL